MAEPVHFIIVFLLLVMALLVLWLQWDEGAHLGLPD
jgi:hypothetical protein